MKEIQATGVLVALFALRCLAPLALTLAIGYLLNRQAARWEAEAAADPPARAAPAVALPCWLVRNCSAEKRERCAAFQQSGQACWRSRLAAEGALPADCATCPLFAGAIAT
jgi:hypothetical protein